MIKKIFATLSAFPAVTKLFSSAAKTGKIDPAETLEALSTISPSTKKISDTAMNTIQRGGGISDVASALQNVGEVEVMGQKINTQTMIQDLKRTGGICGMLANMLEKIPNQPVQDTVNLANMASDVKNWDDIIKSVN